jgi:phage tail sheath gpL-like
MFIPGFILILIAILVPLALSIAYLSGSIRAYDNAIEWYEDKANADRVRASYDKQWGPVSNRRPLFQEGCNVAAEMLEFNDRRNEDLARIDAMKARS